MYKFEAVHFLYLVILFVVCCLKAGAVVISGTITDESKHPVPFCSVYLKGTSIGTTANADGKYRLEISTGSHEVIFRSIGYKLESRKVEATGTDIVLDVTISVEAYHLREAVINASAEDPAYAIIRKAQKMRRFYQEEVPGFTCEAYEKFISKVPSKPDKIMGTKVDMGDDFDSLSKIIYLSESVSKLSIQRPGKRKEEMISSRVRGNPNAYSFAQSFYLRMDFYENLTPFGPRGMVSPVSASAMMYYDYRLEGTFIENGETVNKIKVIPKRNHDPVYSGDLYILENSWRIHSLNLFLTGDQQLPFIDTIRIVQTFIPVSDSAWMLMNSEMSGTGKIFGVQLSVSAVGVFSKYDLNPEFGPHYFDSEVMKINKESNKKDTSYWNSIRPVPITLEERSDFIRHDSLYKAHNTKAYKDSMDRQRNKFSPTNFLISGYSHQNSWRFSETSVSGLLDNLQFNTVEGWVVAMNAVYEKNESEEGRRTQNLILRGRYGFSNRHLNGNLTWQRLYDPFHFGSFSFSAGTDVSDFNEQAGFSRLVNSGYSLFVKKNWLKLYEKRYLSAAYRRELVNGIIFRIRPIWEDRLPLVNTTTFSWNPSLDRDYLSNNPLNKKTDSLSFDRHQAFLVDAQFRFRIRQRYVTHPEGKSITGARGPELRLNYRKAITGIAGSETAYDFASASVSDRFNMGLLGSMQYLVTYGRFLTSEKMEFMDYHHFNGNQTFFGDFNLSDFGLWPYYKSSTNNEFVEAHGAYNMGGLILNKIPLIRKLKLTESIGVHFFHTPDVSSYVETSFGIDYFRLVRVDFVMGFEENKVPVTGFILNINLNAAQRALDVID